MIIKSNGKIEKYFQQNVDMPTQFLKESIGGGTLALHRTSIPFICMYVDDDAIRKNLPTNKNASLLYGTDHEVKGDVILFTVGNEGESLSLTHEVQDKIIKLLEDWHE